MQRRRLWLPLFLVLVTIVSLVNFVAPSSNDAPAQAAVAADFDPGYIISDANMYNGSAMDAGQVQSFLNAQQPGCRSGYTCLNGYAQRTPTLAADRYCTAGYTGSASESAASIIARVGQACNISQKVLLVLLQKEQSLVTSSAPSATAYNSATGFGCPDTAPCDSSVAGFFYQVYYAARQYHVYRLNPASFGYRPGQVNSIYWHPNAACGTSNVYIQNAATAGLYIYTPYRPNAAALNNLYGVGDACSSYGNRNFWRMYTDWFGDPTQSPGGNFLRETATGRVFLVSNSTRYYVPSREILAEFGPLGPIREVSTATINSYANGPTLGRTVVFPDGSLRLVDNGVWHRFANCAEATAFGFTCDGARLSELQANALTPGDVMRAIVEGSDGHNWLIQNGQRRELSDLSIPARYGYGTSTVDIGSDAIGHLPVGAPVIDAGDAVRSTNAWLVLVRTTDGVYRASARQAQNGGFNSVQVFTDASLAQLPVTRGNLPDLFRVGTNGYVITQRGIVQVSMAAYGGQNRFVSLGAEVISALPPVATVTSAHFVRERNGSMYLASGTRLSLVANTAAYDFIRTTYGVPATIHQVALDALDASILTPGQLIYDPAVRRVHMVNGSTTMYVPSFGITTEIGLGASPVPVSSHVFTVLPSQGTLAGPLLRCNNAAWLAVDGTLLQMSATIYAEFPTAAFTDVDASVCTRLTRVSGDQVTQFLRAPDGRVYFVQDGQRHHVSPAAFRRLNGPSIGVHNVDPSVLQRIPEGVAWTT